jgi:hypothetical protein
MAFHLPYFSQLIESRIFVLCMPLGSVSVPLLTRHLCKSVGVKILLISRNISDGLLRPGVTNNVITSQVAGGLLKGLFPATSNAGVLIQSSSFDSLEPTYSCPTANSLMSDSLYPIILYTGYSCLSQDLITRQARMVRSGNNTLVLAKTCIAPWIGPCSPDSTHRILIRHSAYLALPPMMVAGTLVLISTLLVPRTWVCHDVAPQLLRQLECEAMPRQAITLQDRRRLRLRYPGGGKYSIPVSPDISEGLLLRIGQQGLPSW